MYEKLLDQIRTYLMLDMGVMTTWTSAGAGPRIDMTGEDKELAANEVRAAWRRWRNSLN